MVQARLPVPSPPPDFYGSLEDWEALHADWLSEEWESDEPPLESDFHRRQIDLLIRLLEYHWRDRQDFYASGNTTVFYDPEQRTTRNFRGPDFYVVLGTEKRDRKSWMVWREAGKYPHVVIELLSDSTAKVDRTTKKALYQDTWRVMDYFWCHPETLELQGFSLVNGVYRPLEPNPEGWLWSAQLQLFLGIHSNQLRFFTATGDLVFSPEEAEAARAELAEAQAAQAQEQAAQVQEQLAQERLSKAKLMARLRELGVDPNELI